MRWGEKTNINIYTVYDHHVIQKRQTSLSLCLKTNTLTHWFLSCRNEADVQHKHPAQTLLIGCCGVELNINWSVHAVTAQVLHSRKPVGVRAWVVSRQAGWRCGCGCILFSVPRLFLTLALLKLQMHSACLLSLSCHHWQEQHFAFLLLSGLLFLSAHPAPFCLL